MGADKAYEGLLKFKDVVKKNQVSSPGPAATADSKYGAIDGAAKKLADASYPFLKGIDWTWDIYLKPLPGAGAKDVLKAVDKAIASVPQSQVMDVYNGFAKVVPEMSRTSCSPW